MDYDTLRSWLAGFKAAWENRDPDAAVALFTEDARYATSPLQLSLRGQRSIRAFWNDVPRLQCDVRVEVEPVAVEPGGAGVAHYRGSFRRLADNYIVDQDGLMVIRLDDRQLCWDLGLWAVARSRPGFQLPTR